jgi:hypothetical protein
MKSTKLRVTSIWCAALLVLFCTLPVKSVNPEPDNKLKFANGTIYDIKFLLKHAYYNNGNLLLKSEPTKTFDLDVPAFVGVRITFPHTEKFAGKSYNVVSDERMESTQTDKPYLTLYSIVAGYFSNIKNNAPYDLKLQFYQPTKGLLPGYIDLKIKDSNTTWIRGYFYAEPLK